MKHCHLLAVLDIEAHRVTRYITASSRFVTTVPGERTLEIMMSEGWTYDEAARELRHRLEVAAQLNGPQGKWHRDVLRSLETGALPMPA